MSMRNQVVPWVCLQFVIVVFLDHTHFLTIIVLTDKNTDALLYPWPYYNLESGQSTGDNRHIRTYINFLLHWYMSPTCPMSY